jgi:putative tryptophan/tyrosine transport system substrate-binding protein
MNRRDAALALAALGTVPLATLAQQARKITVIGWLNPGSAAAITGASSAFDGLRAGLRASGYIEGETIRIEERWAKGKPEALPGLAQELVQQKVDIIVAVAPPAVRAAAAATRDVPIVAQDLETDPVASGLVASLAKPGGNLTGLFLNHADLAAKWLQMVKEIVPGARRIAVLRDVSTGPYQIAAITAAAKAMAVSLQVLEFRDAAGILGALNAGLKEGPEALVQLGSPFINQSGKVIADFLAANRLPGISPFRTFADNGGLLSYGPNLPVVYRGLAVYISKILNGTKPGDLPVEQPTHFELIVNQKAAKALGVKIPSSILVRADEVIE